MKDKLTILWTNPDPITSEKMVLMYATNAKKLEWWKEIDIIIWGGPSKLVSENLLIQEKIRECIDTGVHVSACKACADQLGVSETLESIGIELKYWGESLTAVIKEEEDLLTV